MANVKFQNAINRKAQDVPPIWLMRQAGRYHSHYQALKQEHTFMELCKKPRLAAETTMGPIEDFDFDVAILFSDLLFPLEALGMGLKYDPGPVLGHKLTSETIQNIRGVDEALEDLHFQKEACEAIRKVLPDEKSLIGFVGGPWTLFTYASEGSHSGHLLTAKTNFELFNEFCETLVPLLIKNIQLQLDGGAEVVMVFDTAAGELSPGLFQEFVAPQLAKMIGAFKGKLGYYSKGTTFAHYQTGALNETKNDWAGFGFDHRWSITDNFTFGKGFIQGNFDQALLFAEPKEFETRLRDYLKPMLAMTPEQRAGWVCGLGHGVLPKTPQENVRNFVKIVREAFAR